MWLICRKAWLFWITKKLLRIAFRFFTINCYHIGIMVLVLIPTNLCIALIWILQNFRGHQNLPNMPIDRWSKWGSYSWFEHHSRFRCMAIFQCKGHVALENSKKEQLNVSQTAIVYMWHFPRNRCLVGYNFRLFCPGRASQGGFLPDLGTFHQGDIDTSWTSVCMSSNFLSSRHVWTKYCVDSV